MSLKIVSCVALLPILCLGACKVAGSGRHEQAGAGSAEAGMDPEQMMEMMRKLSEPGEGHAFLDRLVGNWKAEARFWFMGDEAQTSSGSMRNSLIFGGRFLQQEYEASSGTMGTMHGLGLLGFDNGRGEYVGTWIDDMSTMMMPTSYGSLLEGGDILVMSRQMADPMTGIMKTIRDITTIVSENEHRLEMWESAPGTDERRTLEVIYTRID